MKSKSYTLPSAGPARSLPFRLCYWNASRNQSHNLEPAPVTQPNQPTLVQLKIENTWNRPTRSGAGSQSMEDK